MQLSEERTNFLGIPVTGDFNPGARSKPQKSKDEFAPLIQAVLDDPFIAEFGWKQYTPYFNDGDPCVFSAYGVWFRTAKDTPKPAPEVVVDNVTRILLDRASGVLSVENAAMLKNLVMEALRKEAEQATEDDEDDCDYEELEIDSHPILGTRRWVGGRYEDIVRSPEVIATAEKCEALASAIESGEFDNVLMQAFGDHCEINVTREGITINDYSHD